MLTPNPVVIYAKELTPNLVAIFAELTRTTGVRPFTTHARSGREYFDILLISSGITTIEMVMETIEIVVADLKSYQSTEFSPVSNNRAVMMAM